MIDIKLIRENRDLVKENIKKKFQDEKLPLVDEVYELDKRYRELKVKADNDRKDRNSISDNIGALMREGKKEEGLKLKDKVVLINKELESIEVEEVELEEKIKNIMYKIPNIIDASVPIGKDDSQNVEVQRFLDAKVPSYEIPYHADIMNKLNGLDKDASARTSGNGFYYLMGDIARLSSAMLAYARDFMINKGFIYCIPPFMIRSDVVNGVMSFKEMDAMMYKIEGEDLFLIGTSEHSMIGKFKGELIDEAKLPITMTSYSPCFRKEVGAHGIEERGIYRVHQFEKQEMIVLCKPEILSKLKEKGVVSNSFNTVNEVFVAQILMSENGTLGANAMVYLYYQKDNVVDELKNVNFVQIIEQLVQLRKHGNNMALSVNTRDLNKIRDNMLDIVKLIGGN